MGGSSRIRCPKLAAASLLLRWIFEKERGVGSCIDGEGGPCHKVGAGDFHIRREDAVEIDGRRRPEVLVGRETFT